MIGSMREISCALRLDRCRYQPDLPVAVEILMEARLEQFKGSPARSRSRH